jgi:peptide subunit release factor 1 (eRF1)
MLWEGAKMGIQELSQRRERSAALITLSVSHDTSLKRVINQVRKESANARNIRDKDTRKKVLKALNKLLHRLFLLKVGNGFFAFAAHDGV